MAENLGRSGGGGGRRSGGGSANGEAKSGARRGMSALMAIG